MGYDPDNPAESVLVRAPLGKPLHELGVGLLSVAAGIQQPAARRASLRFEVRAPCRFAVIPRAGATPPLISASDGALRRRPAANQKRFHRYWLVTSWWNWTSPAFTVVPSSFAQRSAAAIFTSANLPWTDSPKSSTIHLLCLKRRTAS